LNIAFLPQSSQVKMLFKSRLFSDGYAFLATIATVATAATTATAGAKGGAVGAQKLLRASITARPKHHDETVLGVSGLSLTKSIFLLRRPEP